MYNCQICKLESFFFQLFVSLTLPARSLSQHNFLIILGFTWIEKLALIFPMCLLLKRDSCNSSFPPLTPSLLSSFSYLTLLRYIFSRYALPI
ncbi:hypothetical protein BDB00DRAFT_327477 [Zychaea mexicana]|uniref:uncharacterized protein n=1 Tax=Zychaea mexicana TaxID=64656 RepID=UPI0022FE31E9|nr:uncharacterized protein BDB00DRAFT_327477 [Zychaea mexicana]KAI9498953.1 hypothetical protein BDB00DRAFT_327477 [Zychaea mexicana]